MVKAIRADKCGIQIDTMIQLSAYLLKKILSVNIIAEKVFFTIGKGGREYMIILIATMKAKQGKEAELEAALKSVIPMVGLEKGTLQYVLHRSQDDSSKFLFYEKYADKEALDFHGATPYLRELFSTIPELLSEKPSIALYEEVASAK
jgi:quinol monooxygenase YgiN